MLRTISNSEYPATQRFTQIGLRWFPTSGLRKTLISMIICCPRTWVIYLSSLTKIFYTGESSPKTISHKNLARSAPLQVVERQSREACAANTTAAPPAFKERVSFAYFKAHGCARAVANTDVEKATAISREKK